MPAACGGWAATPGGVRRLGRDPAEVPLSVEAMKLWHGIAELVDDDCGFIPCGQLKVAENGQELSAQRARVQALRDLGHDHEELIGAAELRELVPALSDRCAGAIWCRDDGAANPYRTVSAFHRKACALGAVVEAGTAVTAIRKQGRDWRVTSSRGNFTAPLLVNAAGAWGGKICEMIGDHAPVAAKAPMLMITERVAPFLEPVLGAEGRTLSFKQFDNGTLLIGGGYLGHVLADENRAPVRAAVRTAGLAASARTVTALFPQLAAVKVVRFWAGIEGVMPDAIPVIGPSAAEENAYHVFGFSAHGFQLGPITGRIVAELAATGSASLPIAPFALTRFQPAA
jgi:sarcosine oxidase subunit beta